MFVVIYRWSLQLGKEEEFRAAWRRATQAIHAERGGLGSRLHHAVDGMWLAYAQWPSRKAWHDAQESEPADPEAAAIMRDCSDHFEVVHQLEVAEDLLGLPDPGAGVP